MADPAWLVVARALIGTKETPGPANNPRIMDWANKLGVKKLGVAYANDATPWCGLFVAHCFNAIGIEPAKIAVRAKAWATWGVAVTPCVGAVLVFNREGGGHVGIYVGEDDTHLHVLGGNQGDMVKIARIPKADLIACRWPAGVAVTGKPQRLDPKLAPAGQSQA